ncbi:hypothetical protein IU449_01145 [Nocardia higoensis]|uniref:DUF2269 family protein n=1 Tax=Nocardia higoensis TaxID=228599 RepID=A0ABS0D3U0_9NOCA|nr:hypothetical protein [Nocardia higoensis]MBF6353168.1 hypothetical protein [Nocardia higoensis]
MTGFLLSVHVLAAILSIGPVAVVASMYPPAVRAAHRDPDDARKVAIVGVLHRISRVYAVVGVFVPVFGFATGASLGVLGDAWLVVSMILTAVAAVLLMGVILPAQEAALATIGASRPVSVPAAGAPEAAGVASSPLERLTARLGMATGMFNLLWVIVVVLMIYRPGSTTGAGL